MRYKTTEGFDMAQFAFVRLRSAHLNGHSTLSNFTQISAAINENAEAKF